MIAEKILIPTDGSDYGKTAIEYGIYIAKRLKAQLMGLHVVDIRLMQGPVFTDISGSVGRRLTRSFSRYCKAVLVKGQRLFYRPSKQCANRQDCILR